VLKIKGVKVLCFGSVHYKGVAERFSASVHFRGLTGFCGRPRGWVFAARQEESAEQNTAEVNRVRLLCQYYYCLKPLMDALNNIT
jgi:hypothetical protein